MRLGIGSALATLAATLVASGAAAQEEPESLLLDPVVVTAPTSGISDGAVSARAVGPEELAGAFQGAGVETVLNAIPGVTTESTAGDPAIAVNIRGLQSQGRVVVTIDGARQNFARSDHGANGTFYTDPEMLRAMEVVRGPAGAEAAPGAIGGTLSLRTVEAADLIAPGRAGGGEARLRYGSLSEEPTVHLAYAHELGSRASGLLAFTSAKTKDYDAPDGTRVEAAETSLSGLGKLAFSPVEGHDFVLSYSALNSKFRTGVASGFPRDNEMDTTNATLSYAFGAGDATLYRTGTKVSQQGLDADLRPNGLSRSYDTVTDGLRATVRRDVALGWSDHALTFVGEGFRDEVTTDDPTREGGGLTPSGSRRIISLLAEDTISIGERTEVILGLRYLDYRLESDDGDASDASLAPSLTLRRMLFDGVAVYGTVAKADRPPTLSETLVNGLHPPPATFQIRPNPNLKPESALTTEVGVTLSRVGLFLDDDTLNARLAVYRNDVDDYIGLVQRGTLFDAWFQYENVDDVRIDGAELEIAYDTGFAFASLGGQLMDGTNRTTDATVSGIPPNRLTLSGGARNAAETLELGARVNIVGSREDGTLSSEAWTTLDLFLTRAIGERASLGIALNNVTDQNYTPYLNTQPSPGFNALASLSIVF
ncbi:MAG: hypothetical protein DI556_16840 [Rhodovulum sulfidophilum]|uniref:TonB-dependent receptor n=1 Tax=Rhodovulum sulfidophilum TaxID=35806 RepID=A0A2W5N9V3_RHOSU|nr:MAG: hypothetical protein DI556_16840 [Rhodovulum sulfidophilum]